MNIGNLYTSFDGRIGRKQFWVGFLPLLLVMVGILFLSLYAVGETDQWVFRLNKFILMLIFMYPLMALGVKRLHDRGKHGYAVWIFFIPWFLHQITNLLEITGDNLSLNSLDLIFLSINLAITIWFFIDLGLMRGERRTNQYGPDPAEPTLL
jgi:uncharacterized membrane protein YhaH (DUF805 family)